jgi:hypothetical protein
VVVFTDAQGIRTALHRAAGFAQQLDARIRLVCRDKRRILKLLLTPQSVVVIGSKKRWWPTSAQRLARDLQNDGHHVIFAEPR